MRQAPVRSTCADSPPRPQRWVVAAWLTALPLGALADDCSAPQLGLLTGVEHSLWRETDAQGLSLLQEKGTLRVVGLTATGDCSALGWTARWTLARGDRDYDGRSTTQAPFQTQTRLQTQHLAAQVWLPVQHGWDAGMQVGYRSIDRDIAGRGNVLGYPEQFGYWQVALGARYQQTLNEHVRLTAAAWLGGGPGGRVHLDLPRADPTTLRLGRSRLLALDLGLVGGVPSEHEGWAWRAEVSYRQELHQSGPEKTLLRNGTPVGSASQPRIVQRHLGATLHATYRF